MQVVLLLGFAARPDDTPCSPSLPSCFGVFFVYLFGFFFPFWDTSWSLCLAGVGCIYSRQSPAMRMKVLSHLQQ